MTSKSTNIFCHTLLAGKTALVTGAGKGIGKACVESLISAGAKVIAVARTASDLRELERAHGDAVVSWCLDATSDELLLRIAEFGAIDILVNNLGTNTPQLITELDDEVLDRMLDMNLRSLFRITRAMTRQMIEHKIPGSIISIGSQMGHVGSPKRSVYCATKHAVEGLTKALAIELADHGIRVNTVAPTFIETPMTAPMFADPDFQKFVMDRIPLGRVGQVHEVANAVTFLASEAASLTTGSCLKVDGGWSAQ